MGFFFEEKQEVVPIKPKTAALARKQILAGATGCDNCPLQATWGRISSAKMKITGAVKHGDILILGDAPDAEEDRLGGAFSGRNGKLLRQAIPGRMMDRVVYQHLARCAPGSDDKGNSKLPTQQEVHACSAHLADDVNRLPIKAVIGVGAAALARFFPGASLRDVHGTKLPIKIGNATVWFYPVFDPAFLRLDAGRRDPTDGHAWPVFKADMKAFFDNVDRWPKPFIHDDLLPGNILIANSLKDAEEILAEMHGPLAIDLETNNLRPYNTGARLLMGSISDGDLSMAFANDHPDQRHDWALPFMIRTINSREWMAHNIAFEYAWLRFFAEQAGLVFDPALTHDTMALARIYHERERILALDDLSQIHLGVNIKWIMNINAARILDYTLLEAQQYCGLDTLSCARIYKALIKKVDKANYRRLVDSSCAVADMALMGLDIDLEASATLKTKWQAKAQEAEERARTLYEVKTFERERGPFSISAAGDVGIALVEYGKLTLPKTPAGKQFKTDDAALTAAAPDGHPLVEAVLDYREAAKMESTYIAVVLDAPTRCYDGRLHPGYTTMHTATTRLSSEDPNIQNWPSRNAEQRKLRSQIVAPPGHLMIKFDYKALEARIIAMATRDRRLCESTISGEDIHAKWRDRSLAIYPAYYDRLVEKSGQTEEKKVLKSGRDIIKTDFVFASFFGASPDSCSKRTGMPLQYMQELSADLWHEHPQVRAWIKEKRAEYKNTGSSRLLTGIVRHSILPGNEPINTPVQGSGAIIVSEALNALAALARKHKDPYIHPRIQIHDDLTFILPDDDRLAGYIDVIVPELLKVRFDWQIVPLAVEAAIGASWESMEEFGNFVGEYIR